MKCTILIQMLCVNGQTVFNSNNKLKFYYK